MAKQLLQLAPATYSCAAQQHLPLNGIFFQFPLKRTATKWSCLSHFSDESQKELPHTRHAILNYLLEDFLQLLFKWLMHCQKRKPGLSKSFTQPTTTIPGFPLNPPDKLIENHRFLRPSAPSSLSPLFDCSQTQPNRPAVRKDTEH